MPKTNIRQLLAHQQLPFPPTPAVPANRHASAALTQGCGGGGAASAGVAGGGGGGATAAGAGAGGAAAGAAAGATAAASSSAHAPSGGQHRQAAAAPRPTSWRRLAMSCMAVGGRATTGCGCGVGACWPVGWPAPAAQRTVASRMVAIVVTRRGSQRACKLGRGRPDPPTSTWMHGPGGGLHSALSTSASSCGDAMVRAKRPRQPAALPQHPAAFAAARAPPLLAPGNRVVRTAQLQPWNAFA